MKTSINTEIKDDVIITTVVDDYVKTYCQNILDIQEEQVRAALIKLGWKPPEEKDD